ncbi:MAG: type II secretion system minor pseudopilin GspK [Gammaproteobacteria bacterium]|nr:type II secretion system minor pseudopilin GspK [Gammaproteobacteria bacterium]MCP5200340.1 type II secretion system minor pseudopilin GspK [Gammaproteobacteria bacterium]
MARTRIRARGVALVTVLLIVAVLTTVVGRLSFDNQLWLRQAENAAARVEAGEVVRAAQLWIGILLERDDSQVDARTEDWARPLPPLPVGAALVTGRLEDLQGRFNLNNLVGADGAADELAVEQFERLLAVLDLDPHIAPAVVDWIDGDGEQRGPWGAEDGYYLGLSPPYVTANRRLESGAELRLVRGVDGRSWRRLAPFVTALPNSTTLNVNTARAEVLAAAMTVWGSAPGAIGRAERWWQVAASTPAPDLEAFAAAVLDEGVEALPPGLAVNSAYFAADVVVALDRVNLARRTVYQRGGNGAILRQEDILQ